MTEIGERADELLTRYLFMDDHKTLNRWWIDYARWVSDTLQFLKDVRNMEACDVKKES